jgi:hypothetical protein
LRVVTSAIDGLRITAFDLGSIPFEARNSMADQNSPVRAATAIEIVRVQEATVIEVGRVDKEAARVRVGSLGVGA